MLRLGSDGAQSCNGFHSAACARIKPSILRGFLKLLLASQLLYFMTFDIGSLGSLRLRNQFVVVLVTIVIALSVTGASAKRTIPAHHPSSQLVKVGAYPTQVVATVRSVTMQKIYLGPEFSDDHADATLC